MRHTKLVLAIVALLTMMMAVGAAPAMADADIDRECFPFCDGHHHDFDDTFVEVDDCEFVGFDGDEAVFVCEVDFD